MACTKIPSYIGNHTRKIINELKWAWPCKSVHFKEEAWLSKISITILVFLYSRTVSCDRLLKTLAECKILDFSGRGLTTCEFNRKNI